MHPSQPSSLRHGLLLGLGFGISVSAVGLAWIGILALIAYFGPARESWQEVDAPLDVRVIEQAEVQGAAYLTIQGVLKNDSETRWQRVVVKAVVRAGGVEAECETFVYGLLPKSRHGFQVECGKVSAEPVQGRTYTLSVTHGYALVPDA
jgi:hypothetical protein